MMTDQFRKSQQKILAYTGGRMGIAAVPGSGKTWTLSHLAARLITGGALDDDQEVLVVTLVNSAVDNFSRRISSQIQQQGLLSNLGYRVRTLHGLANDIVRERPSRVGLSNDFQIIDENEANAIRQDAALAWMRSNPNGLDTWLKPDLDEYSRNKVMRDSLPELVQNFALSFIRTAKDMQLGPEDLRRRIQEVSGLLPLAEMGLSIYTDYQRALAYRGAVDFDDLISLALRALRSDDLFVNRLREQWPFILEDEAQDSSRLQEQILDLLTGDTGNWVRVGDPNQAIYETFTTANPQFLLNFLNRPNVNRQSLPESGRSTFSIIDLANHLVDWTMTAHDQEIRNALIAPPFIQPTRPDDPQPNPPDNPDKIVLAIEKRFNPKEEIAAVADSLQAWLPEHPDQTVAVLISTNRRAFEIADELKKRGIPYVDSLLRSSSSTRFSAGALTHILKFLAEPQSTVKLTNAFKVWRRRDREDKQLSLLVEHCTNLLRRCTHVEDYLYPGADIDWLAEMQKAGAEPEALVLLEQFRPICRRWLAAARLPVDQIILTLSQDIFFEPSELAVTYKLASAMRQVNMAHPAYRLSDLTEELASIAKNERRFLGFSEEDTGFDTDRYPGQVVIATMHKAKGLEWDRVYLMSVNNYDFPSGESGDRYMPERWFVRDSLNLEAETLAQLNALLSNDPYEWYEEGQATLSARRDYVRERLRLLYVGITRAKRELVVTWNSGPRGELKPALPFTELARFWEHLRNGNS